MLSDFRVSRIEGEDNESSENSTSVIAMAGNDKAKFVSAWGQKPALKKIWRSRRDRTCDLQFTKPPPA
jgi:hypothetical protein